MGFAKPPSILISRFLQDTSQILQFNFQSFRVFAGVSHEFTEFMNLFFQKIYTGPQFSLFKCNQWVCNGGT